MKIRSAMMLGLVLSMSGALYATADDKPADAKADVKGVRLTKPFSDLKDLTPEQGTKIKEIHKKYLAEIKAIEAKQMDEEMAILTDDQKKVVAALATSKPKARTAADKNAPAAADPKAPAPK